MPRTARSVAFAREAEDARQAVHKDLAALTSVLSELGYADEKGHLDAFARRFADYEALDRRILELAVENTNLKAQRLSFGPAQAAADAFRDAISDVTAAHSQDRWRVEALVARAVGTVREIQVLQAPHIADADDAVMTRMEGSMARSEAAARAALDVLGPLVESSSRRRLEVAAVALNEFADLNRQIVTLSRRNTNVRSLALSLDQKRTLTIACEESLRALRDALSRHGHIGVRR